MKVVCSGSRYLFLLLAGLAAMAAAPIAAQSPGGPDAKAPVYVEQRNDPFYTTDRMDWPGPNQYRDASGSPGPAYWQQRADYAIHASLDTGKHTLTGSETVR